MATEVIYRLREVRVSKVIAAAAGYTANDVVNDDICTTTSDPWEFTVGASNSRSGYITGATIFSETASLTPRLTLFLFNATPTCALTDNVASTCPVAADRSKWIGRIDFPAMSEIGAVASTTMATPSTVGNLPLGYQCAAADTKIYGVLVTKDAFTQTATNDIEIVLMVEQC